VTLSNISEGLYSIEEIEKLLVDMKATKKQTEERLNMIMQAELPGDDDDTQVYKKPWVGLTEEDLDYLCHLAYTGDEEFALTVQAMLKKKNG
jgi:hypothetical protein